MSSSNTSHATLRYTGMRLGIFLGCLVVVAVLAYVGVIPEGIGKSNPIWIFLLALIVSAPLSYVLLRKQRAAMSEQIAGGVDRAKGKLAANRSMEDAEAANAEADDDREQSQAAEADDDTEQSDHASEDDAKDGEDAKATSP